MDNLLTAKLHFFLSVAKQIEPFLVMYQTDKLMVPFLSMDLFKLVKSLMERFVESALLKDVTSVALTSIDISKADCFVDYSKVDIGVHNRECCESCEEKVSDKQLLDFHLSCRNFLKAVVAKLLNKTAVQ